MILNFTEETFHRVTNSVEFFVQWNSWVSVGSAGDDNIGASALEGSTVSIRVICHVRNHGGGLSSTQKRQEHVYFMQLSGSKGELEWITRS